MFVPQVAVQHLTVALIIILMFATILIRRYLGITIEDVLAEMVLIYLISSLLITRSHPS